MAELRTRTDMGDPCGIGSATSVSTVRRRLNRVIDEGLLSFRCDTAPMITGWPVSATFRSTVPPEQLDRTACALARLPEIRLCAAVTGSQNLLMTVWLRSLNDSQRLEEQLAADLATLRLTERAINLRGAKRMGRLIDETGCCAGIVPIAPWSEET
ncbi:Lrp/AsnC family transcriptional regulator [Streptomyces phyllanthi]|nr:Lrp/AsnC ligand binding domain-containing protein [Streptomyces phyllanthi]